MAVKQELQALFASPKVELSDVQRVVREAFQQGKFEPVFRYYFSLMRRGRTEPASLLRYAIAWTAYRFLLKDRKRLRVWVAQPFALKYTNLAEDFVPEVPADLAAVLLHRAYQLPDTARVRTSGVLISPSTFNHKDPRLVPLLLQQPPRLPVRTHQVGWHFRLWLVDLEVPLPYRPVAFAQEFMPEAADLLREYARAEEVVVVQPVEIFDVWLAYDSLNALARELERREEASRADG